VAAVHIKRLVAMEQQQQVEQLLPIIVEVLVVLMEVEAWQEQVHGVLAAAADGSLQEVTVLEVMGVQYMEKEALGQLLQGELEEDILVVVVWKCIEELVQAAAEVAVPIIQVLISLILQVREREMAK
jgi:hypothetical protein